jgi:hypothetical protein
MKIISYLLVLVGITIIFLHGFFPSQFIIDNYTVFIFLIIFIPCIAPFIKEVNFLGAKFIFKEEIRKTEKLINASSTIKIRTKVDGSLVIAELKSLDNAKKLLDADPVLALAALRIEIEKSLKSIAEKLDFPIREKRSITEIIVNLKRKEIFSHEQVLILRKIIEMCNKAVHGVAISKGEAKKIIFITEKFYRTLENSILVDKNNKN